MRIKKIQFPMNNLVLNIMPIPIQLKMKIKKLVIKKMIILSYLVKEKKN